MADLNLTIPEEALAGIQLPSTELEEELRKRLAAALFSDGVISGTAACKMCGLSKVEFQHMLGERGIPQPLNVDDLEKELESFEKWKQQVSYPTPPQ